MVYRINNKPAIIIFLVILFGDTYCAGCQGYGDARDEGEVVPWVRSVPHGGEQEGGCCWVVRTALITHPTGNVHNQV